jgi:hypothetical protein
MFNRLLDWVETHTLEAAGAVLVGGVVVFVALLYLLARTG